MSRRPLLLLDVDGVLCPFGPASGEPMVECVAGAMPVRYAQELPKRLRVLAERFTPVWATGWGHSANEHLTGLFGLPRLPVIAFDDADFVLGGSWKLAAVQRWVRDRPFAWIDDELGDDVHRWGCKRPQPTLLVDADPCVGMTPDHADELLRFAEALQ